MESNVAAPGRRPILILFGLLFATATVVSYYSIRDSWPAPTRPDGAASPRSVAMLEDAPLPPGPHLDQFQASCLICHSARLPLGQPELSRAKWAEVVHKMVAAYGAPLDEDEEARVVDYLATVQARR